MEFFNQLILAVSVASFITFQVLFHYLSSWVSTYVSPGFKKLSEKQKIEWNSRTVSTFHALVVGIFCLYILRFDDAVNEDPVWPAMQPPQSYSVGRQRSSGQLTGKPTGVAGARGDPALVKLNVAVTTGYLISDLLLIFYHWKAIGDKFFVVHHLAALYAYYYVLGQGLLPYFANFRLLAEFSTPCVNQRWFFEVLGYPKSSKPNIANGVLMAVIFFLVRIAVMPIYYERMFSIYGTEAFYRLPFGGRSAWMCSSICLDVMNVMWMHRIARGCYRVLRYRKKTEVDAQENGKID
ncbi:TM56B protein, partial [Polyodon spathula]|nr:TM56B protein [Polyodon spathula]